MSLLPNHATFISFWVSSLFFLPKKAFTNTFLVFKILRLFHHGDIITTALFQTPCIVPFFILGDYSAGKGKVVAYVGKGGRGSRAKGREGNQAERPPLLQLHSFVDRN